MSEAIRMHDHVESDGKVRRSLRAPRKDELFTQLLDVAEEFLDAPRKDRREAELNLLKIVDHVKARLRR
jgi:hypothetical protein